MATAQRRPAPKPKTPAEPAEAPCGPDPQRERIRVLLAGDDTGVTRLAGQCLERMTTLRAAVACAASLDEARAALTGEPFDVILIDTRLVTAGCGRWVDPFGGKDIKPAVVYVAGGSRDGGWRPAPPESPYLLYREHLSPPMLESAIRSSRYTRQLEHRLNEAYVDLERATRSRADFFAKIGHDLKTPLNSIIGYSEAIAGEAFGPLGDRRYRDYAKAVREAGAHLLVLIDNLIHFSAGDAQPAAFRRCDLNQLAASAIRMTDMLRQKRGHRLVKTLAPQPVCVDCQPSAITQAIINLLSNAIKYTGENGRIEVAVRETDRHGEVAITDNGIGMSAADLSVALRPFGRVALPPEMAQEGTGLGLHIVREIMARHHGQLDISSAPGNGTTAILRLPRPREEPKRG